MHIIFHKFFQKKLKKRTAKERDQFNNRLRIFTSDSNNPILNNHALHGKYLGCRSINVTGDLRAVYKIQNEVKNGDIALFVDIDNHPNLYK